MAIANEMAQRHGLFRARSHDDGEKMCAYTARQAAERDLDRVVEIVCDHPSTARHIATKLAQKLVSEQPPVTLVDRVAKVFTETGGDIKAMLREVLHSGEFKASRGLKFKRPFHFIASCLRATGRYARPQAAH